MGNIPLELIKTGEQRDALGRRRTPVERRSHLVQAFKRSGLSMASFAAREGVHYTTFAGWVQRSRRERQGRQPQQVSFAQVRLPVAVAAAPLEVQLADGTVLRGGSAAELSTLVKALRA